MSRDASPARRVRIVIAKLGLDSHYRGAVMVARHLAERGVEVVFLGNQLPGAGTVYLGQDLRFHAPVHVGDTVTAKVTAKEKRADRHVVLFDCACTNQEGTVVMTGLAEVIAPLEKRATPFIERPQLTVPFRRAAAPEAPTQVEELERLARLRSDELLTEEEYAAAKGRLLGAGTPS